MAKTGGVVLAALALLLGPVSCMVGLAIGVHPSAGAPATCSTGVLTVGTIPRQLTASTADGVRLTLDQTQLTRAATIVSIGSRTPGVGRDGGLVALMAALTESSLRMLSNTGAYPESAGFPHDGNGGDHDSLGLFQMRPSSGWGTVPELMDPTFQARAFFGGPTGPNHGSPRGLLDIPGWRQLDPGAAAQAVEISGYPDRYARYQPVATAILAALAAPASAGPSQGTGASRPVPESTRVVFPLPAGTWVKTSGFGMRTDPVTGVRTLHTGADFAAPLGTPILAAADGRVVFAGRVSSGYGHLILIQHTIGGRTVVSGYAHMFGGGIHVKAGDWVTAGQHVADVGEDGKATGPHLHFEIRPGSANAAPIDPVPWLADHGATDVASATDSATAQAGC